jgi:Family of unknown function (DUF5641)
LAVRSVKRALSRAISSGHLTYDKFALSIVKVEALLNSRPIILRPSSTDIQTITPRKLLVGKSLLRNTSSELTQLPPNSNMRIPLIKQIHETFWKIWQNTYLTTLMARSKWLNHPTHEISVGDKDLIYNDETPEN